MLCFLVFVEIFILVFAVDLLGKVLVMLL